MKTNKNKVFKILILSLFILVLGSKAYAQSSRNDLLNDAITTRIAGDDVLIKHNYLIISNDQLSNEKLAALVKGTRDNETLVLICIEQKDYESFRCGYDNVNKTSDEARIIKFALPNNRILLTKYFGKEIIVTPESLVLDSDTNDQLYTYLKTYEKNTEDLLNFKSLEEGTSIQELAYLLLAVILVVLSFLFVFVLTRHRNKKHLSRGLNSLKNSVLASQLLTLNIYVSIIGISIIILGLLLVSLKDVGRIDIPYIYLWATSALENISEIDSTIVLLALLLYSSIILNIAALILTTLHKFRYTLVQDIRSFFTRLNVKALLATIMGVQIISLVFLSISAIQLISTLNSLIIILLIIFRSSRKGLFKGISISWRLTLFLFGLVYTITIALSNVGMVGNRENSIRLSLKSDDRAFLAPKELEIQSGSLPQYLTSNEPIFLKDIMIFHPNFNKISYVRIKDVAFSGNTFITESNEKRLINALIDANYISNLYQDNPSNYFSVEGPGVAKNIEIQIKCTKYIEPRQLVLSYFSQRNNERYEVLFFPGCYRENLTIKIILPDQEAIIPGYIYKLSGISSDQISYVRVNDLPVKYLKLDKIRKRDKFSYINLSDDSNVSEEVIVGTDEGSYLEKGFSELINNNISNNKVNLTPILTYFRNRNIISEEEPVKIDSLYDDVFIEFLE